MPLSLPVAHRSLGFKERMLERAEFLARAIKSLEKGPPTPSWPWEKIKEDDMEDPLLQQDASAVQASTSQQISDLLRKNLAEADAELQAKRNAERRWASRQAGNNSTKSPVGAANQSNIPPYLIRVSRACHKYIA